MNPRVIEKVEGSTEDSEAVLMDQEFVSNPEYRVREVLDAAGWQVKGFLRLECGES